MSLTSGLISSGFASTTVLGVGATFFSTITGFDADLVVEAVVVTFLGVIATGLVTRTGFLVVVTFLVVFTTGFVALTGLTVVVTFFSTIAVYDADLVDEVLLLVVLLGVEVFVLVVVTLEEDLRVINVKNELTL